MQVSVSLQENFIQEIILLTIFITIVLGIGLYFIFNKKHQKLPKNNSYSDIREIKKRYLQKLEMLETKLNKGKVHDKKAHFEISSIIRNFAYEMTNIKVQNYTLKEIKNLNNPNLYELMEKCYLVEFPKDSSGDAKKLIDKTRKVIEQWS